MVIIYVYGFTHNSDEEQDSIFISQYIEEFGIDHDNIVVSSREPLVFQFNTKFVHDAAKIIKCAKYVSYEGNNIVFWIRNVKLDYKKTLRIDFSSPKDIFELDCELRDKIDVEFVRKIEDSSFIALMHNEKSTNEALSLLSDLDIKCSAMTEMELIDLQLQIGDLSVPPLVLVDPHIDSLSIKFSDLKQQFASMLLFNEFENAVSIALNSCK